MRAVSKRGDALSVSRRLRKESVKMREEKFGGPLKNAGIRKIAQKKRKDENPLLWGARLQVMYEKGGLIGGKMKKRVLFLQYSKSQSRGRDLSGPLRRTLLGANRKKGWPSQICTGQKSRPEKKH